MNLESEIIMQLKVQCTPLLEVGDDGRGDLRVIPIIGGTFDGKLRGEVVSGGADWNTDLGEGLAHVFAKYLLKTEDGEYIAIENEGKINFNSSGFIKTTPRFQVSSTGKYAWLNTGVYVASLDGGKEEGQVEITIYRLK